MGFLHYLDQTYDLPGQPGTPDQWIRLAIILVFSVGPVVMFKLAAEANRLKLLTLKLPTLKLPEITWAPPSTFQWCDRHGLFGDRHSACWEAWSDEKGHGTWQSETL